MRVIEVFDLESCEAGYSENRTDLDRSDGTPDSMSRALPFSGKPGVPLLRCSGWGVLLGLSLSPFDLPAYAIIFSTTTLLSAGSSFFDCGGDVVCPLLFSASFDICEVV